VHRFKNKLTQKHNKPETPTNQSPSRPAVAPRP
jgi:hypothetical protein